MKHAAYMLKPTFKRHLLATNLCIKIDGRVEMVSYSVNAWVATIWLDEGMHLSYYFTCMNLAD